MTWLFFQSQFWWCLGCIIAGFAAGFLGVVFFNAVPAHWLCDYGETPDSELSGQRLAHKNIFLLGIVFSVAFLLFYLQYSKMTFSFVLLSAASIPIVLAAVSDMKYRIIPDQCLAAAAVPAAINLIYRLLAGNNFFHTVVSPFLGALTGGLIWILIGLLGRIVYHKESIGFGDVKLFAVIGFLCGFPDVIFVFVLTILLAGIHFSILILAHKIDFQQYMPMGPYICTACLIVLAFRNQISATVGWYLSLL